MVADDFPPELLERFAEPGAFVRITTWESALATDAPGHWEGPPKCLWTDGPYLYVLFEWVAFKTKQSDPVWTLHTKDNRFHHVELAHLDRITDDGGGRMTIHKSDAGDPERIVLLAPGYVDPSGRPPLTIDELARLQQAV